MALTTQVLLLHFAVVMAMRAPTKATGKQA
jgi:hypothetical protein